MQSNQKGGNSKNNIENRKPIEKINKTRSWFSEKIFKITKPLCRQIKGYRMKTQITKSID